MKIKYPQNTESQLAWRKRHIEIGWKFYSIFAPEEVVRKMKNYYKKLKAKK